MCASRTLLLVVAVLIAVVAVFVVDVEDYLFGESMEGSAVVGQETMLRAQFDHFGAPDDVLSLVEAAVPKYGKKDLLVEIHAAALNPIDYKVIKGNFKMADGLFKRTVGFDFAGKVVAVGAKCKQFKVGDVVHGMTKFTNTGTIAQYHSMPEINAAFVPEGQSMDQAAGLPLVGMTSSIIAPLVQKTSRVLVLGGGSATGMAAIQIAKAHGAAVIVTTCSPRNAELVQSLGATEWINYREEDVFEVMAKREQQFDIIYDTIGGGGGPGSSGGAVWKGAADGGVLANGGSLITITGDQQSKMSVWELAKRGAQIMSRNMFLKFKRGGARYVQHTSAPGDTETLTSLNSAGVKIMVDKTFDFSTEGVRAAMNYLMTGRARGKVVISVKQMDGEAPPSAGADSVAAAADSAGTAAAE